MCFLVFALFCLCFTLILPLFFFPSPVFSKGLKTYYSRSLFGFTQPFPFSSCFDLPCSWTVITCGRYFETPHKKHQNREMMETKTVNNIYISCFIRFLVYNCRVSKPFKRVLFYFFKGLQIIIGFHAWVPGTSNPF